MRGTASLTELLVQAWMAQSNRRRGAIALGSGMLAALAAEPVRAWPLTWIALAPLWLLLLTPLFPRRRTRVRVAFGLLWGVGYYSVSLAWITGLHPLTWMGVPWLDSLAIALVCWVFVTVYGAVWVGLWAGLFGLVSDAISDRRSLPARLSTASPVATGVSAQDYRVPSVAEFAEFTPEPDEKAIALKRSSLLWPAVLRVLVGVALWCGIEAFLSQGVLYWPSLAFTQSPNNLLILHLGQIAGPTTVIAAILAVNGFLAEAGLAQIQASYSVSGSRRRSEPRRQFLGHICGAIALLLFLGLHGLGLALYAQPLAPANADSVAIGIVQGNVPTRIKLFEDGLRRAFVDYAKGYETLVDQGAAAVLTPEGAYPIYWKAPTSTRTPLYQAVLERDVPVWLGTFLPQGNSITQSLITLDGQGQIVSHYDKVKLVPLGEYIPFEEVLGRLINRLSPLQSYMLPGSFSQTFQTPFGQAIVGICYESAFPELFRQQAANGGEFILTASNNDPYNTVMMAQHHAQDVMRAVETDRWAVRATNTGYSGVVDPHGRTLWRSQAHDYQTHLASIHRRQTRTLYVRWGDWVTPILVGGAIALTALHLLLRSRFT